MASDISEVGPMDLWTRAEPAGRRPRFTREQIAAAAMRIADTEGFDALSMRRLAAELEAGTMTLYHYVRTKDELLALLVDAVMAEVVVPADEPLPDDWREAISVVARRSLASMRRHPWMLDISDDPPFGPNSVRHFDQTMQALSSLEAPVPVRLDIASVIDEYVFGFAIFERNNLGNETASLGDETETYVNGLLRDGSAPTLAALAADHGVAQLWSMIEDHLRDRGRFERNLRRLLDGIEADVRAGVTATS
jgi:AcrR family transcriptional regulator